MQITFALAHTHQVWLWDNMDVLHQRVVQLPRHDRRLQSVFLVILDSQVPEKSIWLVCIFICIWYINIYITFSKYTVGSHVFDLSNPHFKWEDSNAIKCKLIAGLCSFHALALNQCYYVYCRMLTVKQYSGSNLDLMVFRIPNNMKKMIWPHKAIPLHWEDLWKV